ncbi:DUF4222 domain-containing protein [Escherichia coli]|uniref:DUF4222 domain-containing protein n=1 Tax=Escherichia coli TaxID=562 RepID=UPI003004425B
MSEDVPLPKVNQRYKDDHGALVTLTSVEETRVVFMRDGYPHPCMRIFMKGDHSITSIEIG